MWVDKNGRELGTIEVDEDGAEIVVGSKGRILGEIWTDSDGEFLVYSNNQANSVKNPQTRNPPKQYRQPIPIRVVSEPVKQSSYVQYTGRVSEPVHEETREFTPRQVPEVEINKARTEVYTRPGILNPSSAGENYQGEVYLEQEPLYKDIYVPGARADASGEYHIPYTGISGPTYQTQSTELVRVHIGPTVFSPTPQAIPSFDD